MCQVLYRLGDSNIEMKGTVLDSKNSQPRKKMHSLETNTYA